MLNVVHNHAFVSQKCEKTLVFEYVNMRINTPRRQHLLCGNTVVEIKHKKLGDNLHTDTSS